MTIGRIDRIEKKLDRWAVKEFLSAYSGQPHTRLLNVARIAPPPKRTDPLPPHLDDNREILQLFGIRDLPLNVLKTTGNGGGRVLTCLINGCCVATNTTKITTGSD